MRGWVLADSEIDPLELTPELQDFAREMVGESAVELTMYRTRFPGHTFVLCRLA